MLPFPPKPWGKAGPTIARPLTSIARAAAFPANAPNIVVIMLDDVGPALPDTFGGVIETPTLSRLAQDGLSYNRFHNAAMCPLAGGIADRAQSPSGRERPIAELANDWDGYTGRIPRTSATVAKVLGYYGYATAAFGKWHNTPANETTAVGPYTDWPAGEVSGSIISMVSLLESSRGARSGRKHRSRRPVSGKEGYHFTEDMTTRRSHGWRCRADAGPALLMYWAPGAAHGPHHISRTGRTSTRQFDDGWDAMRERICPPKTTRMDPRTRN